MSWIDQVGKLLKRQTGSGAAAAPAVDVNALFDQVTREAPSNVIAEGLASAFRSKETPGFANLLSTLFTNSTGEQKAGMLNHLIPAVGPDLISNMLTRTGLAGVVSAGSANLTQDQALKFNPEMVKELAGQAEKANPSIIETLSNFYAQHSALLKTLGAPVLTVLLAQIARRQNAA